MVASSSERFCAFYSCFEPVFSCLVIVSNDITITRETFSASVPVTAVVLKYSPRFMVVPVDRSALNPSLAAVPACRVVNVNFPPCRFLFEPAKRIWRNCMFWIEGLLESCLRCFDSFGRAINHRLPLGAPFGMPLKVASLSESCTAMNTCIRSCKLRNILDDERVPLVNSDCQNVLQLGWWVSSKVPYHFTLHAHRLIDTDTEPIRESCSLFQVSFNLIKFIERCFRPVVWSSSEFEETLSKLSCCCCASIWSCTAVYRNATPETQVVLVGVKCCHWSRAPTRKGTQPVWQGACAQQWLTVEHDLYINIRITPKHPFCVWSFYVINVQACLLLFSQPIFRFNIPVYPR